MNVPEQQMKDYHYDVHTSLNESVLKHTFGQSESIFSNETLQFEDYSKVVFSYFDPEERKERHRNVFPRDCKRAFELGTRLIKAGKEVTGVNVRSGMRTNGAQ
jgi:hypothetical protein